MEVGRSRALFVKPEKLALVPTEDVVWVLDRFSGKASDAPEPTLFGGDRGGRAKIGGGGPGLLFPS